MNQWKIGDQVIKKITATDEIVREIARISGDINPVHLDDRYAKKTIFRKRIAHGLFCLNGISMVIGNDIPGVGSILLSQTFRYNKPVYIEDEIQVIVKIKDIEETKGIYELETFCINQGQEVVLEGISKVKWRPQ